MLSRTTLAAFVAVLATSSLSAQQSELRALTEATFNPNGAHDDGAHFKDPLAPYEDELALEFQRELEGQAANATSAAPANDDCANATIIPGSVVSYAPALLNTSTASGEPCESSESCAGLGSSHSVWYSYTPTADGEIAIDTFGSNYDTVLSVFNRCGFQSGIFCVSGTELACNNNFGFGTTSQIYLPVSSGQTYLIKVAAAFGSNGNLLDFQLRYLPPNNNCVEPTEIVGDAFNPPLLSTHNADTDVCEPNESCEFNGVGVSNSVWYRYVAPCDGFIDLNTNGSTYDTILSIWDGCSTLVGGTSCIYPNEILCDDDSGTGTASQLTNVPVQAGTTYLIKVADYNTASGGGFLDFNFLFTASDQPTADITTPGNFGPACGVTSIVGTAAASSGGYISWILESRPVSGGSWSFLASSATAVNAGVLTSWNTAGLSTGYYLLRLTAANACGTTASDTEVVWVDQGFTGLDLRAPAPGLVYGETIQVDGTAWDQAFDHYTLMYRPSGGSYTPIEPGVPQYAVSVTNDPLLPGGWDTIAAGIPDGSYDVRLRGVDQCGFFAKEVSSIVIDNTPPVALITHPSPKDRLMRSVAVRGSATDLNLDSWTLEVSGGRSNDWSLLAQGSGAVSNGLFTTWNTGGLTPGPYTLRLTVEDRSILACGLPNRAEYLVSVHVGKTGPVLE